MKWWDDDLSLSHFAMGCYDWLVDCIFRYLLSSNTRDLGSNATVLLGVPIHHTLHFDISYM